MVKRLLYLGGLAILGVVLIHTAGMGFVSMFAWSNRYLPEAVSPTEFVGSLQYYGLRLIEQSASISYAAFLFVSGYFISIATGRNQKTVSWKIVGGRIKNLVIPYLIWSVFVIILLMIQGGRYSVGEIIIKLLTGSTGPVYYFVPLLVQFYLLAPFLVPVARNNWKVLLVLICLIQLIIQLAYSPVFWGRDVPEILGAIGNIPNWFFLSHILWFPLGMIIGFHGDRFKPALGRSKWVLLFASIIMIPLALVEWEMLFRLSGHVWLDHRETITDTIYFLCVFFTFLAFYDVKLPWTRQINFVGSRAYGIYLTHAIAIEYTAKIIYHFVPVILGIQIIFLPILFLIGLGVPLIMMEIVSRTPLRRFYAFLFG